MNSILKTFFWEIHQYFISFSFQLKTRQEEFTAMAQNLITVKWQNKSSNLATQVSIGRWLDQDVVHIYTMEYYLAIKKNEITPFAATWVDLKIDILSEVRYRKKIIIWYPLYAESKKKWYKWTYLQNRNRLTDLENEIYMITGETDEGKGLLGSLE